MTTAQWISINDRLPSVRQSVALVHMSRWENAPMDRNIYACGYLDDAFSATPYWSIRGERAQMLDAFTHWLPLPMTPAESEAIASHEVQA